MTAIVLRGDARNLPLPDNCVDLLVTSPPYFGLRSYTDNVKCLRCIDMDREGRDLRQAWPDYDAHVREVHVRHYDGQIGSEATPGEWVAALVDCTREWMRVLRPSGSIFVNLGDKYSGAQQQNSGRQSTVSSAEYWRRSKLSGIPNKSLMGLPWRYALACVDQLGLILRAEIIWAKPNGLPESVTDRVRRSHEQVFHFTRLPRYYSAVDEIREAQAEAWRSTGRTENRGTKWTATNGAFGLSGDTPREYNPLGKLPGSVWDIPSQPLVVPPELGVDHFAAFPMELPRRIILGWSPPGVCTACGEGRPPVVAGGRKGDGSKFLKAAMRVSSFDWAAWKESKPHRITGYSCACTPCPTLGCEHCVDPPTRPAIVLDPFGGTGTTALVASAYGRLGISVDRSADYCRLARWRTTDPGQRAAALQVPKPPPQVDGQLDLWAAAD